ncbi:hypothetical protein E2C01_037986 [Portunus trituberculatus]|uniref:Uncharacterized protein n=1 Tax=Portunus trituberculatus TaxID=210409 RepID=A0A5B7FIN8_PORTR|nr:hypothetical protein [Portunus trituberculatus]
MLNPVFYLGNEQNLPVHSCSRLHLSPAPPHPFTSHAPPPLHCTPRPSPRTPSAVLSFLPVTRHHSSLTPAAPSPHIPHAHSSFLAHESPLLTHSLPCSLLLIPHPSRLLLFITCLLVSATSSSSHTNSTSHLHFTPSQRCSSSSVPCLYHLTSAIRT